jgi:RNA polymerase sigma-70 factor, ECF subfamily
MMAPVEVPPISTAARASARTQDSSRRHSTDGPVGPELSLFVQAARDGDERAFRSLYRAVQPGLLRYLRVLVGDEAEDVASEAWLQIVRDFASFQGDGDDFRAWSATIARHRALDHLRARTRRPQQAVSLDLLGDQPAATDTAAAAIDALSTSSAIALIARLPREQAEAVLLRVVVGLDAVAAARVLGKRAGAVRTSAYRGLRRLAHLVAEANGGASPSSDAPASSDAAASSNAPASSDAALSQRSAASAARPPEQRRRDAVPSDVSQPQSSGPRANGSRPAGRRERPNVGDVYGADVDGINAAGTDANGVDGNDEAWPRDRGMATAATTKMCNRQTPSDLYGRSTTLARCDVLVCSCAGAHDG